MKTRKYIQQLKNLVREGLTDLLFRRYLGGLRPGDIAIDCGANVGDITLRLAATGATVYAFEPNPFAFATLQKRTAGLDKVICINKGVWDRPTTTRLYFHKEAAGNEEFWSFASSIFSSKGNVDPGHWSEVELVDLALFIEDLAKPVALLKIDIEGAECELLERFIDRELYRRVGMTLVETHDRKIPGLRGKTDRIRKAIRGKGISNIRLSWL